jgi:hypothetical protein
LQDSEKQPRQGLCWMHPERHGLGPRILPRELPHLESFSGSEPWRDFLGQFERHMEFQGLSQEDAAILLGMYMKGEALHYYQQLPDRVRRHYQSATEALNRRFGVLFSAETQRVRFQNTCQLEGETLRRFADRLKGMAMDAFAGLPEWYVESELVNRFLLGCTARDAAVYCINTELRTLDAAVEAVQRFMEKQRAFNTQKKVRLLEPESNTDSMRSPSTIVRVECETISTSLQVQIDALTKTVKDLVTQMVHLPSQTRLESTASNQQAPRSRWGTTPPGSPQGRQRSPSPRPGCFNCGDLEHFARELPTL